MGLRLAEGVDLGRLERLGGRPWDELIERAALERFVADGWLPARGRLAASAAGRQRLNGILAACGPARRCVEGADRSRAAAAARGRGADGGAPLQAVGEAVEAGDEEPRGPGLPRRLRA